MESERDWFYKMAKFTYLESDEARIQNQVRLTPKTSACTIVHSVSWYLKKGFRLMEPLGSYSQESSDKKHLGEK